MDYGFTDGIKRAGDSLWKIIRGGFVGDDKIGYDLNNPEHKQIKDNLESVQGKTWGDTVKDIAGVDFSGSPLLLVAVIMLVILALRD